MKAGALSVQVKGFFYEFEWGPSMAAVAVASTSGHHEDSSHHLPCPQANKREVEALVAMGVKRVSPEDPSRAGPDFPTHTGICPRLMEAAREIGMPLLVLLWLCSEGDNAMDALGLASKANEALGLLDGLPEKGEEI
jgi:hypothetical protein